MGKNSNLARAKDAKEDEFYTRLEDIEAELGHYSRQFRGKTVLCNCDDPMASNFTKYFCLKFKELGLKELICTCYKNCDYSLFTSNADEHGMYFSYKGTNGLDHVPGESEIDMHYLEGDGDFRSDECREIMKRADVIVTNPPFSKFRDYLTQIIRLEKRFLIIGSRNALTYKEVFPLIKENQVWLGYGFSGGNAYFRTTADPSQFAEGVYDPETKLVKFRNCCWFTNMDVVSRHESLVLVKKYYDADGKADDNAYPKFDHYDAINVDKVTDIPKDFSGVMGVPITFLDKYNPEQFEIIDANGIRDSGTPAKPAGLIKDSDASIQHGKRKTYARVCIRLREGK